MMNVSAISHLSALKCAKRETILLLAINIHFSIRTGENRSMLDCRRMSIEFYIKHHLSYLHVIVLEVLHHRTFLVISKGNQYMLMLSMKFFN